MVGILVGIGAFLVENQFGLIERILIAAGILLIGIYVALDPEDVWAKMTGRGALASGNTLVIAAAALLILGLFNVLGSRYTNKVDLTANQQFTLSDQSKKVAENLQQPVHVVGVSDQHRLAQARFPDAAERLCIEVGQQAVVRLHRPRAAPRRRDRGRHHRDRNRRLPDGRQEAEQHRHD